MNNQNYQRSIELLNKAVDNEIATSLQYIYFHVRLEDKGYRPLSVFFERTAIREMQHIEMLADRIMLLQGDVDMNTSFKTKQISDVAEMLRFATHLEKQTVDNYNEWSKETSELKDGATHELFQKLIEDEEQHLDHFRTETDNISLYGDQYLALQTVDNLKHITK